MRTSSFLWNLRETLVSDILKNVSCQEPETRKCVIGFLVDVVSFRFVFSSPLGEETKKRGNPKNRKLTDGEFLLVDYILLFIC